MPKFNFFEYGHQIKGNDTYSNLVANIVPADTPTTSGVGGGQNIFSECSHIAYHIEGNEA